MRRGQAATANGFCQVSMPNISNVVTEHINHVCGRVGAEGRVKPADAMPTSVQNEMATREAPTPPSPGP